MKVFTESVGGGAPLTCYVLDPSLEMATAGVRPVVLVLPGGGYEFTSDREAEPVAMAYLAEGFHACVLRYATGAQVPWSASHADGLAALAWIREHAAEYGFDASRIVVVGFSAGGHLAASLGGTDGRPDVLVLGYPVTLGDWGPPTGKDIPDATAAVTPDYPPTFLFSTSDDQTVPIAHSLALLTAFSEQGVPFEAHIYRTGTHGISLAKWHTAKGQPDLVDPAIAGWLSDSVRFLHATLGEFGDQPERVADR